MAANEDEHLIPFVKWLLERKPLTYIKCIICMLANAIYYSDSKFNGFQVYMY